MAPRVVVLSLASDFGCQLQMTNIEDDLLAVLGRIELSYWQLASSAQMPDEYDVAIVEGAVTMPEHVELLETGPRDGRGRHRGRGVRDERRHPGARGRRRGRVARGRLRRRRPDGSRCDAMPPRGVTSVIDVDYLVPGCPIDTGEYLRRALARAAGHARPHPHRADVRLVQDQREHLLLRERRDLPGRRHAHRVRRAGASRSAGRAPDAAGWRPTPTSTSARDGLRRARLRPRRGPGHAPHLQLRRGGDAVAMSTLNVSHVARIEGHGDITVEIEGGARPRGAPGRHRARPLLRDDGRGPRATPTPRSSRAASAGSARRTTP